MRHPVSKRLLPFLRRDLKSRLATSLVTVIALTGLVCLAIAALTRVDSRDVHHLRLALRLEAAGWVCDGPDQPACSYDDRAQAKVNEDFAADQRLRLAVLDELSFRVRRALIRLEQAASAVQETTPHESTAAIQHSMALEESVVHAIVDLRPAAVPSAEARRQRMVWPLLALRDCQGDSAWATCDATTLAWKRGAVPSSEVTSSLRDQFAFEEAMLRELEQRLGTLVQRETVGIREQRFVDRKALRHALTLNDRVLDTPDVLAAKVELSKWLDLSESEVGEGLAHAALSDPTRLWEMIANSEAAVWQGGWFDEDAADKPIIKPTERYRSPIEAAQQWQLVGSALFLLGALMLTVVAPIVTATNTAREREAGTLPVLRMTGLSAGDLALAMGLGPNVFALVTGGALLLLAVPILCVTASVSATFGALALTSLLSAITLLTAIGLGDALGHRVNALVVGGLLAFGLLGPGLVGSVMVAGDIAATGFLLGPVPTVAVSSIALGGLPFAEYAAHGGSSTLGCSIFAYGILMQALLGALSLMSWRRRVEQAWAPLFHPLEGLWLAIGSVGCSALAVLDLSERVHVQSYDDVNLITFVATGFLMPILGWLLVSSLAHPARAGATASVQEVRRAFMRFQAFVGLTALALAASYAVVLDRTGLSHEESEIMWATIGQCLLIAETVVAALLLSFRQREGNHRLLLLAAALVVMQLVAAVVVYQLEVEHVAIARSAGNPFLLGMQASPYWLAFLVLLWSAGLGFILAALLRERDREKPTEAEDLAEGGHDDDNGSKPTRWLH